MPRFKHAGTHAAEHGCGRGQSSTTVPCGRPGSAYTGSGVPGPQRLELRADRDAVEQCDRRQQRPQQQREHPGEWSVDLAERATELDVRRQPGRRGHAEHHRDPRPEGQPAQGRLPPPRRVVEQHRDREHQQHQPERPAGDVPEQVRPLRPAVVLHHRVGERPARDQGEEADTDRDRQDRGEHRGAAVLRERLPVAADAVDAIAAPFDLRHRGGHRQQREEQAEGEGDLAGVLAGLAAGDRAGQRILLATAGGDRLDRLRDHRCGALLVEVGDQPGERQQERHHRQTRLQRQGPAVGEAVAVSEAHERLDRDPLEAVLAHHLPGVLAVELVAVHLRGDRDRAGGGHRAASTRALCRWPTSS